MCVEGRGGAQLCHGLGEESHQATWPLENGPKTAESRGGWVWGQEGRSIHNHPAAMRSTRSVLQGSPHCS